MTYPTLISTQDFLPVTASELREYLRWDDGETDAVLESYIKSATDYLERAARCSIIRKRYQTLLNPYRGQSYTLPLGPVTELIDIQADGQTSDVALYTVENDRLSVPYYADQFKVTYDVGYASAEEIPPAYKLAILACSADLFVHRFTSDSNVKPLSNHMIQHYVGLLRNVSL